MTEDTYTATGYCTDCGVPSQHVTTDCPDGYIAIKTLTGKTIYLEHDSCNTIASVKERIQGTRARGVVNHLVFIQGIAEKGGGCCTKQEILLPHWPGYILRLVALVSRGGML